jgi:hypothetical protein
MKLREEVAVVDIETSSKEINAVINTISLVIINLRSGEIKDTLHLRCDLNQPNRITDESTLAFWADRSLTSMAAYKEAFGDEHERYPLSTSLKCANEFIKDNLGDDANVFGNGPEFDNSILVHAMSQLGISPAWSFRGNQSLRTAVLLGQKLLDVDPRSSIPFSGIKHLSLDDALHEAEALHEIYKSFLHAVDPRMLKSDKVVCISELNERVSQLSEELEERIEVYPKEVQNASYRFALANVASKLNEVSDLVGRIDSVYQNELLTVNE